MDIRLTVDGGASPQAPPGRIAESPPPKEEFEKTLQTAKMEETPGEVAENEPNAQLQTLDSEKKETGTKNPGDSTPVQILIDPTILSQLQMVGIAQLTETGGIKGLTFNLKDQQSIRKDLNGPLKPLSGSPLTSTLAKELTGSTLAQPSIEGKSEVKTLDATKDQTLSNLLGTAFEGKSVVKVEDNAQSNSTVSALIKQDPRPQSSPLITSEVKMTLNVTSVQSNSSAVTDDIVKGRVDGSQTIAQTPVANLSGKSDKPITATNSNTLVEVTVESLEKTFQGQSQSNDGTDKQKDKANAQVPEIAPNNSAVESAQETKSTPTLQLTSTERQTMVDTISKKIDELAIRSVRNEVRVEMHPPELGSVVINIRKDLAGLTATLNASNEPLRQALHESRNDLAGALADRNVGQVRIEVRGANADTSNMGQQFNQAQSQHQNQQHQSRQASKHTGEATLKSRDQVAEPTARRAVTTLLDMEI